VGCTVELTDRRRWHYYLDFDLLFLPPPHRFLTTSLELFYPKMATLHILHSCRLARLNSTFNPDDRRCLHKVSLRQHPNYFNLRGHYHALIKAVQTKLSTYQICVWARAATSTPKWYLFGNSHRLCSHLQAKVTFTSPARAVM